MTIEQLHHDLFEYVNKLSSLRENIYILLQHKMEAEASLNELTDEFVDKLKGA